MLSNLDKILKFFKIKKIKKNKKITPNNLDPKKTEKKKFVKNFNDSCGIHI